MSDRKPNEIPSVAFPDVPEGAEVVQVSPYPLDLISTNKDKTRRRYRRGGVFVPVPTPDPTPDPVPAPGAGPFRLGVGLVQGCWDADAKRLADRPGLVGAIHVTSFGGNSTGSDALARSKWFPAGVDVMLHAAIAPTNLSLSGVAWDAKTRLRDSAAAAAYGTQVATVCNGNRAIKWVTFTNEWKGYWGASGTPGGWDGPTFMAHYLAFAIAFRAKCDHHVDLGGPYTDGGGDTSIQTYRHQIFIDRVVKPRPDLVDFICWDDGNGLGDGGKSDSCDWYIGFYAKQGIHLPQWDVELYPGGHDVNPPPSDAQVLSEMRQLAAKGMAGVLIWGPGDRPDINNSETHQNALLWPSNQVPTPLWKALIAQDYSR